MRFSMSERALFHRRGGDFTTCPAPRIPRGDQSLTIIGTQDWTSLTRATGSLIPETSHHTDYQVYDSGRPKPRDIR